MTPDCPNPHKVRYATGEAASRRCTATELRIGVPVYPYECICGFWHLTKNPSAHLPMWREPRPEDIERLQHLPADEFTDIVRADIRSQNPAEERIALRHPHLRTRWRWTLRSLLSEVNQQLAGRTTDDFHSRTWRSRAERFRDATTLRLAECQRFRPQTTQAA